MGSSFSIKILSFSSVWSAVKREKQHASKQDGCCYQLLKCVQEQCADAEGRTDGGCECDDCERRPSLRKQAVMQMLAARTPAKWRAAVAQATHDDEEHVQKRYPQHQKRGRHFPAGDDRQCAEQKTVEHRAGIAEDHPLNRKRKEHACPANTREHERE